MTAPADSTSATEASGVPVGAAAVSVAGGGVVGSAAVVGSAVVGSAVVGPTVVAAAADDAAADDEGAAEVAAAVDDELVVGVVASSCRRQRRRAPLFRRRPGRCGGADCGSQGSRGSSRSVRPARRPIVTSTLHTVTRRERPGGFDETAGFYPADTVILISVPSARIGPVAKRDESSKVAAGVAVDRHVNNSEAMNKLLILAGCVAGVAASAVSGALVTDPDSRYYLTLVKPSWQPPPPVYGIVWTPLYADIALSSGHAISELGQQGRTTERKRLVAALGGQPRAEHHLVVAVLPGASPMVGRRRMRGAHGELGGSGAAGRRGRPAGRVRTLAVSGVVCLRDRADRRGCPVESPVRDRCAVEIAEVRDTSSRTTNPSNRDIRRPCRASARRLRCVHKLLTVMTTPSTRRRTCRVPAHRACSRASCTVIDARSSWPAKGPALLLLHGLGCDHTTWAPVIDQLSRRFTVIAPDLLGHGASDKPRADYTLGGFANGMRDLLALLGIDRVTVVGHSFGGGVAMQFAYQFPQYTERLMLVAPGGLGRGVNPLLRGLTLPGAGSVLAAAASPPVLAAARFLGERAHAAAPARIHRHSRGAVRARRQAQSAGAQRLSCTCCAPLSTGGVRW